MHGVMDAGLQLRIRVGSALGRLGLLAGQRVECIDDLAGGRAVLAVEAVVEAHG